MKQAIKLIFFLVFSLFLLASVFTLRPFGAPKHHEMDSYFLENGQRETASNNIVTSIVFDYRGLDTLGEATVLFSAVSGVALLFRGALK